MKYTLFTLLFCLFTAVTFAQKGKISGVVKDPVTGETMIGANVVYGPGLGTVTDFDGHYEIEVDYGTYEVTFSFVGTVSVTKKVVVDQANVSLSVELAGVTLSEMEVVADVARDRETPVAFTNISPKKLEEELASQDLPMVLNSTPGVYATQTGGGDGDARISIRGFNQRNVAVMLDGIPVNDMENGWVYWSNWFGLDGVTRTIQVQRGLGASKIAIPSVGGTMNIITKGIEQKAGGTVKQEVGSFGFMRTTIGLNSGKLKNGWGWTAAGSFKRGDGFVDQTYSEGWFYYAKVQKTTGKHIISASAMGAPQEHGQRAYQKEIGLYSEEQRAKLFADTSQYTAPPVSNMGMNYNEHWGTYRSYDITQRGDTIWGQNNMVREKKNYFHKPMFSLRDFWTINDKLYLSTIAYASIGRGGGTGNSGTIGRIEDPNDENFGQHNYQSVYDANAHGAFNFYSNHERFSSTILRSSINSHDWYGMLTTFNYVKSPSTKFSGGLDGRYYHGQHYREVYDLLGGDVYYDFADNNSKSGIKRVGDKIDYNYDSFVKWAGGFVQAEHKTGVMTMFANLSGAYSGYKRVDYFRPMEIVLPNGDVMKDAVGYETGGIATVAYDADSNAYTRNSPEARFSQTDWVYIPSFTAKGGLNYNITEKQNAFVNIGFISKAQRFDNVISRSNDVYDSYNNELVKAFELGYSIKSKKYAANVNGYYTAWENKPYSGRFNPPGYDPEDNAITNISGMNALHMGVEVDGIYKPLKNLDIEAVVSIGDWKWNSVARADVFIDNDLDSTFYFDAEGLAVGDAAQTQFGLSVKYKPVKAVYLKARATYFGRNFSNFNPFTVDRMENGDPVQSWEMPEYYTLDIHVGYFFKVKKLRFNFRVSALNALDATYIADATNNSQYIPQMQGSNVAETASVFFGLGRRINTSLKITF